MSKPAKPVRPVAAPRSSAAPRIVSLDHARLEALEQRQLMAAGTVVSLPYRLDFATDVADSVVDKDGQGTGLTRVQNNVNVSDYDASLIDLDTTAGVLKITAAGTASNSGPDNALQNLLETQFDGTTSGFSITTRLITPRTYLTAPYQQAGLSFGPDQDNFIKVVALRHDAGTFLQFKDELGGLASLPDDQTRFNIGSFAGINTLDLRLVGDAATGRVSAFYSINGQSFVKVNREYTLNSAQRAAFFTAESRAGLMVGKKNALAPITATFDSFEITAGTSLADRPSVRATRPAAGATGINRDSAVAADVNLPTVGAGVDPSTLNNNTVKLYRKSDGALVNGVYNTTGGGDAIVFQPTSPL
ncbi:MAG TPA: Ig-like domain-containing protein, partial [Tepidisphaeraceae bacterium]